MQFNAEAWVECAVDHALTVDFQNARGGKPSHQGLANSRRVSPGFRGEQKRLSYRFDRKGYDNLVGNLCRLTIPIATDQGNVLAHQLEYWFDPLEDGLLAADHNRPRGLLAPDFA